MGLDEVAQTTTSFEQASTAAILYTADSLEVKSSFPGGSLAIHKKLKRSQFRGGVGGLHL